MSGSAEYLVALYIAEHRDCAPVSSGTVADALGKYTGTVTEMFQKLAADGLLEYEPYEGATLTEAGRARAAEHHETYVTLSWFFRSGLDLDDHETRAMELASIVSVDVAQRLAATLPTDDDLADVCLEDAFGGNGE